VPSKSSSTRARGADEGDRKDDFMDDFGSARDGGVEDMTACHQAINREAAIPLGAIDSAGAGVLRA
jgi:hypothetical protein